MAAPPPDVQEGVLLFNRVHKTGSENFVAMLQVLAKRNGFTHERCHFCSPDGKRITQEQQVV